MAGGIANRRVAVGHFVGRVHPEFLGGFAFAVLDVLWVGPGDEQGNSRAHDSAIIKARASITAGEQPGGKTYRRSTEQTRGAGTVDVIITGLLTRHW